MTSQLNPTKESPTRCNQRCSLERMPSKHSNTLSIINEKRCVAQSANVNTSGSEAFHRFSSESKETFPTHSFRVKWSKCCAIKEEKQTHVVHEHNRQLCIITKWYTFYPIQIAGKREWIFADCMKINVAWVLTQKRRNKSFCMKQNSM